MTLFIDLVRKYSKKLFALINCDKSPNDNAIIPNELIQTIDNFTSMVFHKKIDELINELSVNTIDTKPTMYTTNEIDKNKDIVALVGRYEENIMRITRQRDDIGKLLVIKEEELRKFKESKSNELDLLKRKLTEQTNSIEEIKNYLDIARNNNKLIESKCLMLEEENTMYKKRISKLSDKTSKDASINKDINYKDFIIQYLETLLKKLKVDPKFIDNDLYLDHYNKSRRKSNDANNTNDDEQNYTDHDNMRESTGLTDPPMQIKHDIEELDTEILQLQTELRMMLDKK